MSIVKMSRLSIIGLEDDREAILEMLHKSGCVQITDTDPSGYGSCAWKYEHDKRSEQIGGFIDDICRARDVLLLHDRRKKNMFASRRDVSELEFEEHINRETEIFSKVVEINKLLDSKNELAGEENRLWNQKSSLEPWYGLDVDLGMMSTRSTISVIGVLPNFVMTDELRKEIGAEYKETLIDVVSSDSIQQYLYVIIYHEDYKPVTDILKKHGFSQVVFRNTAGTASHITDGINKRLGQIEKIKREIDGKVEAFASDIGEIELLYDYLMLEKQKIDQVPHFIRTEKTFMIEGWIPERQRKELGRQLAGRVPVYIRYEDVKKGEEYPILLENKPFIKPFELITELFSLPNSREFDVNPFMAPFYFLFFGLMLGDAGYGLVLALVSGIILLRFKISGTMKKLISMVFFGGISTFCWGVLFGSWFGDIFSQVSKGSFTIGPLWFDPLKDPMKLLLWSCAFGVMQLYVGMALAGYKMWKDGRKKDALIDIGSRYVYYTGLIMLLASAPYAVYVAGAGAASMLITQGRHKNGIGKITGGILSLYDVVGFMSDVLSYSRLLALGLATSVVASVINTMGTLFGINILGIIVLVMVFIVGHIFNMAINTLGAYVHSSRLQYVEFFGKFYDGGGKPYRPFKYDMKYTTIINGGINDGFLDER